MGCIPLPGGGYVCTRGSRRPAPCQEVGCGQPHVALCDWPLTGRAAGRTCDRRMCARHRNEVGPDRDYCPTHFRMRAQQLQLGVQMEPKP